MNDTKDIEIIDLQQELAVFDPVAEAVEQAKVRCANIILCYDTPQEIKEAKSFIYQIRKLKGPVAEVHKLAKAEALKFTKALDAKKRELMGAIAEMIDEKEGPIKELEEKETQRLAEEALAKQREEEAAEAERQAEIDRQKRELMEKEAELLERQNELDRKEREQELAEQWAREAEEKAKQAAIDAENRRLADVQREKDKAAAEQMKLDREREEKEAAHQAAIQRQKEADEARAADDAHRSKIHRAIYLCYTDELNIDKIIARYLTQALINGKIPHVTINY